jgi:hypothetical protein
MSIKIAVNSKIEINNIKSILHFLTICILKVPGHLTENIFEHTLLTEEMSLVVSFTFSRTMKFLAHPEANYVTFFKYFRNVDVCCATQIANPMFPFKYLSFLVYGRSLIFILFYLILLFLLNLLSCYLCILLFVIARSFAHVAVSPVSKVFFFVRIAQEF